MQTECLCPCSPLHRSFTVAPVLHLTFLLQLFLPASLPSPGSHLQVQIFAWSETPSCSSSACLLSSSTSCQACRPPGEDGMDGSSPCIRDCLLQLSAATVLVGGTLIVIPDVTLLCEKVQTVSSSGRPVVKNSMKMDSSVHPKLLNSIRILVSSEQSS